MKRLVRYRLNFESKFLTLSGVMMGFAFFLQALDFFALRQLQQVSIWQLLLYLAIPMVLEACWCVPMRSQNWSWAEPHGVFAALICLTVLGQTILTCGVVPIVFASVFFVLGGACAVMICFGFIAHRFLGMLVFAAIAAMQVLTVTLPGYIADGYMSLVVQLPPVCMILSMMLFFCGIRIREDW